MSDHSFHSGSLGTDRKIVLHHSTGLTEPSFLSLVAEQLATTGLSRRQVPNWIADKVYGFDGELLLEDGSAWHFDDESIDRAFSDDGSFRWISDFLKLPGRPWKQKPQQRVVERIRFIAAALMIEGRIEDAVQLAERKRRQRGIVARRGREYFEGPTAEERAAKEVRELFLLDLLQVRVPKTYAFNADSGPIWTIFRSR